MTYLYLMSYAFLVARFLGAAFELLLVAVLLRPEVFEAVLPCDAFEAVLRAVPLVAVLRAALLVATLRAVLLVAALRPVRLGAVLRPVPFEALFFAGTLAPRSLASDKPIAIACLREVTFFPLRPLFSLPSFISCMASFTFLPAVFE
jgi:hypothetical protein